MTPKLVIFDCDGVLVDSEPASNQALMAVLAKAGLVLTPEECMKHFIGKQMRECGDMAREMGADLPEDWLNEYRVLERELLTAQVRLIPDITIVLDDLDRRRVPFCVASNGSHEKMAITLPLCGLADRFEGNKFSAKDVAHGKPAPDLFQHAAKQMGFDASQAVVVEDSSTGMKAAKAAGMPCFAYTGGHSASEFHGALPFGAMKDLPALIFPDG